MIYSLDSVTKEHAHFCEIKLPQKAFTNSQHNWVQPTQEFSYINPIGKLVQKPQ